MFDEFLRSARDPRRPALRAVRPRCPTTSEYVDGKPRYDGVRSFLASRGIELPEGTRDDPPERGDGRRARQPQERARARADPRARRAGLRRARCATCRRCATRACGAPSSRRAPTAARCWRRPGSRICSRCASTASSPRGSTCAGKPAPDTFLAAARMPRRASRRGGGVRGCARRRRRRDERAGSGSSSASTGSGRPSALRAHGADVVVSDLAELLEPRMITHPAFAVEPWSLRETQLDLDVLAQAESVFALSNGHIGLRANLDEGEPFGLPGHLPELASTSCGRCPTPRPATATRSRARRS